MGRHRQPRKSPRLIYDCLGVRLPHSAIEPFRSEGDRALSWCSLWLSLVPWWLDQKANIRRNVLFVPKEAVSGALSSALPHHTTKIERTDSSFQHITLARILCFCCWLKSAFFSLCFLWSNSALVGSACMWMSIPIWIQQNVHKDITTSLAGVPSKAFPFSDVIYFSTITYKIFSCECRACTSSLRTILVYFGVLGIFVWPLERVASHRARLWIIVCRLNIQV